MTKLRVGVVGLSDHALRNRIPALVAAGAEITAIADQRPNRIAAAQAALAELGCPPAAELDDAARLFASRAVDAVVLVTPTPSHHQLTLRAIEAGLHVLVEKPMATSLVEAREMVDRAVAQQRVLHVGYQKRHIVQAAIDHVGGGLIGTVESVRGTWQRPREGKRKIILPEPFWSDADRGGVTLDLCHMLDLGMRFIPGAPQLVLANAWSHRGRAIHGEPFRAEDSSKGHVLCAGNATAEFDFGWYADGADEVSRLVVIGATGELHVEVPTWQDEEEDMAGLQARLVRGTRVELLDRPLTNLEGHKVSAKAFVADCQSPTYVEPNPQELATQALLDGYRTAFREGRAVVLAA